jgi:hypothetical protein
MKAFHTNGSGKSLAIKKIMYICLDDAENDTAESSLGKHFKSYCV